MQNGSTTLQKSGSSFKKPNMELPRDPATAHLGVQSRKNEDLYVMSFMGDD